MGTSKYFPFFQRAAGWCEAVRSGAEIPPGVACLNGGITVMYPSAQFGEQNLFLASKRRAGISIDISSVFCADRE